MGLLTDASYDSVVTFPLSIPQTELQPGTSILVGSVKLPPGRTLRLRYLGLHVTRVRSSAATLKRIADFYDTVFIGLYSGNIDSINRATGMPVAYVGIDGAGYTSTDPVLYQDFGCAGTYTAILVNNTSTHVYEALSTGSLRML